MKGGGNKNRRRGKRCIKWKQPLFVFSLKDKRKKELEKKKINTKVGSRNRRKEEEQDMGNRKRRGERSKE